MICHECQTQLIEYLNETLTSRERADVAQHLENCEICCARLSRERAMQPALKQVAPVPAPSEGFEARTLAAATRGDHLRSRVSPRVGAAIAAALVLGVVLGAGLFSGASRPPVVATDATSSSVTGSTKAPVLKTVRLAFSSRDTLDNVTLTLDLPSNIELARFPGRQRLSWKIDLKAGDNILALPVRVLFAGSGELVAHLDDGMRQKTFRVRLSGTDPVEKPSS